MRTSDRLRNITGGGSDGWDVFYRARKMVADGKNVIELTIGEHDIRTHPVILDAMHKAATAGHTGYAMVPGTNDLRDTVAKRIQDRTGVQTTRDNIVITPGGQSALFSAHLAALETGDVALYCDPYYATYPGTLRGAGGVPIAILCKPDRNFEPEYADLKRAAKGAKSLLINTPNNPTGVVYSLETMQNIAKVAIEEDLWVISDEVYDTQIWEGEHISLRQLPKMEGRTLVVGSMSKSHAMTGSRVGWICGPEDTIADLINLATHTTYGVPGYIQDAATFALNAGEWLEQEVGNPFSRRRKIAQRIIGGQNIVRAIPNSGAMYQMLDIRATGLSGEEFANALLDQELIAVMPGESFGNAAAGHIRVAMTVPDDAFEDAMERLCSFAQSTLS